MLFTQQPMQLVNPPANAPNYIYTSYLTTGLAQFKTWQHDAYNPRPLQASTDCLPNYSHNQHPAIYSYPTNLAPNNVYPPPQPASIYPYLPPFYPHPAPPVYSAPYNPYPTESRFLPQQPQQNSYPQAQGYPLPAPQVRFLPQQPQQNLYPEAQGCLPSAHPQPPFLTPLPSHRQLYTVKPITGEGDCFPESIAIAFCANPHGRAYLLNQLNTARPINHTGHYTDEALIEFGKTHFRQMISTDLQSSREILETHSSTILTAIHQNDNILLEEYLQLVLPMHAQSAAHHLLTNRPLNNTDELIRTLESAFDTNNLDMLRRRALNTPRVAMGVGDLNPRLIQHETTSILSDFDPQKKCVTQYKLTFINLNIEIYVAKREGHYDPIVPIN